MDIFLEEDGIEITGGMFIGKIRIGTGQTVEGDIPGDDGVILFKIWNLVTKNPVVGGKAMGEHQAFRLGIGMPGNPVMDGSLGGGNCFFQHDVTFFLLSLRLAINKTFVCVLIIL